MEEKFDITQEIRRKLSLGDYVTAQEYLYVLALQKLDFLQNAEEKNEDVFKLDKLTCNTLVKNYPVEGYDFLLENYNAFKNASDEEITQKNNQNYESLKMRHATAMEAIDYQRSLIKRVRDAYPLLEKDYADFVKEVEEILSETEKRAEKALEENVLTPQETNEEYKSRVLKTYEDRIEEYKKNMDRENSYTLETVSNQINNFVNILKSIGDEIPKKDEE